MGNLQERRAEQSTMNVKSVKILLCLAISLTVCQYACSHRGSLYLTPDVYISPSPLLPWFHRSDTSSGNPGKMVLPVHTRADMTTKIAGGKDASLGEFPYMAVVHQLMGYGKIGQCGGTIINKRWVLTAAHCVEGGAQKFFVVFGIIDKSGIGYNTLLGPGVSMIATTAVVHPLYRLAQNDIALLHMPQDIPFSDTIGPIKLAYNRDEHFTGRDAFVVGWGKDYTGSTTTKLKYATLPIIDNRQCKQYWNIDNAHVCTAAGLGRDACQGDSGGPLIVVDENGIDRQVGIVSYGNARCPSDVPGVFTRISEYKNWIDHWITVVSH